MSIISICLANNTIPPKLFFCLSSPKKISSQFGTSHMIKNLLIFIQAFPFMYIITVKTTI